MGFDFKFYLLISVLNKFHNFYKTSISPLILIRLASKMSESPTKCPDTPEGPVGDLTPAREEEEDLLRETPPSSPRAVFTDSSTTAITDPVITEPEPDQPMPLHREPAAETNVFMTREETYQALFNRQGAAGERDRPNSRTGLRMAAQERRRDERRRRWTESDTEVQSDPGTGSGNFFLQEAGQGEDNPFKSAAPTTISPDADDAEAETAAQKSKSWKKTKRGKKKPKNQTDSKSDSNSDPKPVWNRYTFRPNSHYTDAAEDDVIGGLIFQNDLSAGSILMSGPTFTEETKGKEGETYTCRRYFVTVSPEVEAILRENDGFLRLNAVDSVRLHPAPHRSDRPDGSGKSQ